MDQTPETVATSGMRGAFADGLTLLRALLTPAIMAVIIVGWSATRDPALGVDVGEEVFGRMLAASFLATVLFGLAALTDILDNVIGGEETSVYRRFGWFDDVADIILVVGTLIALLWATWQAGALGLGLALPALVVIGRELLVGLVKGYTLMRTGWPQTGWGTAKNALVMLSTLLLVSAPWLTTVVDGLRFTGENAYAVYAEPSNLVWNTGLVGLWATAVLSVVTGVMLLSARPAATDDGST